MVPRILFCVGIFVCYLHIGCSISDDVIMIPDDNGLPVEVLVNCPENYTTPIDLPKQVLFHLFRFANGKEQTAQMAVGGNLPTLFLKNSITKVIIPGCMSTLKSIVIQNLKNAYLKSAGGKYINVIAVDWAALAGNVYFRCYSVPQENTLPVGQYIGRFINYLVDKGAINLQNLHLIGHGLGAHVAGIAGANVTPTVNGSVARISGLDPLGLNFCSMARETVLDRSDAVFVDVIHTETSMLGLKEPLGHVDFYPWGGGHQEGCEYVTCSHSQAHVYFTETILKGDKYPARWCESPNELHNTAYKLNGSQCAEVASNVMGESTDMNKTGYFYTSQPAKSSSPTLSVVAGGVVTLASVLVGVATGQWGR